MKRTTIITITIISDPEEDVFEHHDSLVEGYRSYGYRDGRTTTGGGTALVTTKVEER